MQIETYRRWGEDELTVLLYEFKDGLDRYLANVDGGPESLEALIAWNEREAAGTMPHFGQELLVQAQAKGPLTDAAYLEARERTRRLAGADGLLKALDKDQLDALLAPSMSPAWPTDHVNGDHFTGAGYGIAAVAGTPSITVPSGGLPIGVAFMGRAYSEPTLLGIAHAFEQATRARRAPEFLPTLAQ